MSFKMIFLRVLSISEATSWYLIVSGFSGTISYSCWLSIGTQSEGKGPGCGDALIAGDNRLKKKRNKKINYTIAY